jgi:hypothetical protein
MSTNKRADEARQKSDGVGGNCEPFAVDWRLLPKDSPERKAVLTEERRTRAAAARARKAKLDALNHYVAPPEVLNASDSERRKILAEQVWWAHTHGVDVDPPDEGCRVMQQLKKKHYSLFMKMLFAAVPSPPREAPLRPPERERTEKEVLGNVMDRIDAYLRNMEENANGLAIDA